MTLPHEWHRVPNIPQLRRSVESARAMLDGVRTAIQGADTSAWTDADRAEAAEVLETVGGAATVPAADAYRWRGERDAARETADRLHRRCQRLEVGVAESVERARRGGGSLGRMLANAAAEAAEARADRAEAEVERLRGVMGAGCDDDDAPARDDGDQRTEEDKALFALLVNAPIRLWMCPLHVGPRRMMATVEWDGDVATCLLCGFTSAEHKRRRIQAAAVAAPPVDAATPGKEPTPC